MLSGKLLLASVVFVALLAVAAYFIYPRSALPQHKLQGFDDSAVRLILDGFTIYNLNLRSLLHTVSGPHNTSSFPLKDDIIVVTGATSGLGRSIAAHLLALGAHVVVPVRRNKHSVEQDLITHAEQILKNDFGLAVDLKSKTSPKVTAVDLDLSDLESVLSCVEVLESLLPKVTALVNNAGLINPSNSVSRQNFENTLAVNFLGPALLTHLLLNSSLTKNQSNKLKIISVSSEEHRGAEMIDTHNSFINLNEHFIKTGTLANSLDRYATSKLLQTTYFLSLANGNLNANKLDNVIVFDMCPGPVASAIASRNFDNFLGTVIEKAMTFVFQPPEHAALPIVKLLLDKDMEKLSGSHFHMSKLKEAREDARSEAVQKWVAGELEKVFEQYLEAFKNRKAKVE